MLKAMYRNSDLAKSDTCLADDDIGPDQNATKGKDVSVLDHSDEKTIHSGHFMVSQVHQEQDSGEEDGEQSTAKSPEHCPGYDFVSANQTPQDTYRFGSDEEQMQGRLSIDGSLTRLFECMTLAYSKITSPRWKTFKGMKLNVKDKIRLNNIIWREWHMQYIKSRSPLVCQFAAPLSEDSHSRPEVGTCLAPQPLLRKDEAVVMEGKYWKRRLEHVTAEYKKWRSYFRDKMSQPNMLNEPMNQDVSHAALLDRLTTQDWIRIHPQRSPTPGLTGLDEDLLMDFSDTLFSSFKEPLIFPNPREIGQLGNADFIQPGLVQLQPNFEDLMDTIESLPEIWGTTSGTLSQARSEPSLAVMDAAPTSSNFQVQNTNSFLQSLLASNNRVPETNTPQPSIVQNAVNLNETRQNEMRPPQLRSLLGNNSSPTQPVLCSDLNQAVLAANLNQGQSLLGDQNRSPLSRNLQQTTPIQGGTANNLGQSVSIPAGSIVQQQLISGSIQPAPIMSQTTTPVILQSGINVSSLPCQISNLLSSPQTVNLVPVAAPQSQNLFHQGATSVKIKPANNSQQQHLTLTSQVPANNSDLSMNGTAVRQQSNSLGTTIVSQSIPKTVMVSTPSTSVLASHLVASVNTSPVQPLQKKKGGEFAIPKNKPLPRKPRTIAPAVSNTSIMQQNTFLAQLLSAGHSTGATINLNIKQEGPSSCLSGAPVQNAKTTLNQTIPIAIAPAPPSPMNEFQKNIVIAPATQALNPGIIKQDAFRPITAVSSITTCSPLMSSRCSPDFGNSSPISVGAEAVSTANIQDLDSSFDDSSIHKLFRPKNPVEREQYKEHRRVTHISAEQKRRCNIKNGFDTLQVLVPSLIANPNQKLSKAAMLQKTADFCKKLKVERANMQNEAEVLKQEIEALNLSINACQSQLPATGAPVTRQRVDHMKDMRDEYVRSRTLQNWKFWMFSTIFTDLFDSFNNMVSTATIDDLCRTCLAWLDQHCSLVALRPAVLNSLRRLSTTTSILSDPSKVPEQAQAAVTRRDSDPGPGPMT